MSGLNGDGVALPFVVCASHGGPYEDETFAAGFCSGMLWEQLAWGLPAPEWLTVRTALLPLLDLMAMHHGFAVRVGPTEHGWTRILFDDPNPADRGNR